MSRLRLAARQPDATSTTTTSAKAEAGLVRGERAAHARGRVARAEPAGESGAGERVVDVERARRSVWRGASRDRTGEGTTRRGYP